MSCASDKIGDHMSLLLAFQMVADYLKPDMALKLSEFLGIKPHELDVLKSNAENTDPTMVNYADEYNVSAHLYKKIN